VKQIFAIACFFPPVDINGGIIPENLFRLFRVANPDCIRQVCFFFHQENEKVEKKKKEKSKRPNKI